MARPPRILPPLLFEPIYQDFVWGAPASESQFKTLFGRAVPHNRIAESWEVVDVPPQWNSVVRFGPLAGRSLRYLISEFPNLIFGPEFPAHRFPLIVKFLDIYGSLSIQVHPSDTLAAHLGYPSQGKHEAWVILKAGPGAKIWAGLKEGVTPEQVARALGTNGIVDLLWETVPRSGESYYFPPGTVHAAAGGLFVAEIQQASLLTFRLFDWNRKDQAGRSRPLHIEEGRLAVDYSQGPVLPVRVAQGEECTVAQSLVECPKFSILYAHVKDRVEIDLKHSFKLVVLIGGRAILSGAGEEVPLGPGDVVLVPWCLNRVKLRTMDGKQVRFLEVKPNAG